MPRKKHNWKKECSKQILALIIVTITIMFTLGNATWSKKYPIDKVLIPFPLSLLL